MKIARGAAVIALALAAAAPARACPAGGADEGVAETSGARPGADAAGPGRTPMSPLMAGAYGRYPMSREASGTSWQPDASVHGGAHEMAGDWMLMGHALVNGVYDSQHGPRGGDQTFVSGMAMGMARRSLGADDVLQLRAMLSPDPLMGKRGLPVLLASGETADGRTPLVDRQHPHDLVMELSASDAHALTERDSAFVYAGLPGEPAFGPPAFMHRLSIMDSPEPPISHHWLDSTHISYGVVTAGVVHDAWKLEASRFRGREPDQFRYNIETGRLDSTAARLSWNPTRELSLQASWAAVTSPEQLTPEQNQRKWSASTIYTRTLGAQGWWSTTVAWGRRSAEPGWLDAVAVESAVHVDAGWAVFGRAERVDNDELALAPGGHGPVYTVGKASIGALRDFDLRDHLKIGVGALYAFDFVPAALRSQYGPAPAGAMLFVRLKAE